jgi:hypothetical protein
MDPHISWLDGEEPKEFIKSLIDAGHPNGKIAAAVTLEFDFPTTESSIRRFRKRHGLEEDPGEPEGLSIEGDKAETISPPDAEGKLLAPEDLLREAGLKEEDWELVGFKLNKWGSPDSPRQQTKATWQRKGPSVQIMAPRTDGWKAKAPSRRSLLSEDASHTVVIVGDQQAPFVDWGLHDCFLQWLDTNYPVYGISLGDSVDFPDIRPGHRFDPENTATVNECLQAGYDMFRGYIEASPNTLWTKLIGNHDERIRNILLDTYDARPLYGVKRPDTPDAQGEELHSLAHAMRLDELGIDVIDCNGSYEHGQMNLSSKLAVRHGWIARQGSGVSALATLEHLRYSVIVGHTHRQSIVYKTTFDIDGNLTTLVAAEAGCMCRVEQNVGIDRRRFPSYAPNPDWQQGFMTAEIWPDGKFVLTPAVYVNNVLLYKDQRYEA